MKTLRALSLSVGLLAGVAQWTIAGNALAYSCPLEKLNARPPIEFKPFPLVNPTSGQALRPDELLDVQPGQQMRADEFINRVNDIESKLNQIGYTLREQTTVTVAELFTCVDLLRQQQDWLARLVDPNAPNPATTAEERLRALESSWEQYKQKIPSWEDLYRRANDASVDVYLPPPPPFTAPVPERRRVEFRPAIKERIWNYEIGEKSKFAAGVNASLRLEATKTETRAHAKGAVTAAVLGKWEGDILAASADAVAPIEDKATLNIQVKAVGRTLWSYPPPGARQEGIGIKEDGKKSWPVEKGVDFRFAIGPIPMKGTVGFRAEAGLHYGYTLVPLHVGAFAGPYAAADAYAQCGVDIGIAGGGVGGQLLLIKDSLTLQGDALVQVVDEPSLTIELTGYNKIEALSGSLYAYGYIDLWFKKFEGRYDFFTWEGFSDEATLFHFKKEWTPSGVTIEGDATAEDIMEVRAQQSEQRLVEIENKTQDNLTNTMTAISAGLSAEDAKRVLQDKARHEAIAGALDKVIKTYWDEIRRWAGT